MKKKNKKDKQGFTLVELIAVIAIIAIIAVLAILAYGRIQEAMKEKQLEGIHGHIKSVALDFYEDTRLEDFNVQMLIDYGLLSTNDNTDQIINPVNNKSMNCFDINFTDEVYSITENYTCKTYNFIYDNIFIINEDGSIFDDSIWYNKNLKLKPKLSDELINSGAEIVSVKWTKKGDSSYINTNEVLDLQVADETVLNDIYSVSVSLNNQNYKASSAYAHVKIDKIKPTITEIERTANCGDGASITTKFKDSDSKVKSYSIRKQNSNKNLDGGVLLTPQEETSATFTLNTAGNYVIEAYDNSGNISSYEDYIDAAPKSQTTSIEVYDSSNKRLSSGSTIKDTYKFKIVVDWKNNDCAKEIKYCVDTTNTCSYNNTAKNNTFINAPKTDDGTYYIRYKSVNKDNNVNTGYFIITIKKIVVDAGSLLVSKYAIEEEISNINANLSNKNGFTGSAGSYTISNFDLKKYNWYMAGYNSKSVIQGATLQDAELYGESSTSTVNIGFKIHKDSNISSIRFGLIDENNNYKSLELKLAKLGLEDNLDYFLKFDARVVSKTLTINNVKLYKISSLTSNQWTNKNTLVIFTNNVYTNFRPEYYTIEIPNEAHNISSNYLIHTEETPLKGLKYGITALGTSKADNTYVSSEKKDIILYIDKTKPIINAGYTFVQNHILSSFASVQCFQRVSSSDDHSLIQPNGYLFRDYTNADYDKTPFPYDFTSGERNITKARDKKECRNVEDENNSHNDKIKFVHYPSKVDIYDDEIVVHLCDFKNHKYYYSRSYYYNYISYIYKNAHKDDLSGIDTGVSEKLKQISYTDYAGVDMDSNNKSCGRTTVPCITEYQYNIYDKAGNNAGGMKIKFVVHMYDQADYDNDYSRRYKYNCANTISQMNDLNVYLLCERKYYSNGKWAYQRINNKDYGINQECFSDIANGIALF